MKIHVKVKKEEIRDLLFVITQAKEAGAINAKNLLIDSRELGLKLVEILSKKDQKNENDEIKLPLSHWHFDLFFKLLEFVEFQSDIYYQILIIKIYEQIKKQTDEAIRNIKAKWIFTGNGNFGKLPGNT